MKKHLKFKSLLMVTAAAVLLSACGSGGSETGGNAGSSAPADSNGASGASAGKTTITYVVPRSIESMEDAHILAAEKMGYFDEEGIEIKFEQALGTSDVKTIATGQGDVALPSPWIMLTSLENQLPIKSVFQPYQENIFVYAVREDSGINSIKDLKGKTITLGDAAWSTISNPLILYAGLDYQKDVEYVSAGENRAQMVQEGKADAVLTWEGEYQLWEAQGMKFKILPGYEVLDNNANMAVVSHQYLKDNPDLIVKFFRAYAKGIHFTKTNPEAATEITLDKFPSIQVPFEDAVTVVKATSAVMNNEDSEQYGYGYHNEEKWKRNVDAAFKTGLITSQIPVDQIYTNEFIEEINNFDKAAVEEDAKSYQLKPEHQPKQ